MGRSLSVTVCLLWLPRECLRPHLKKQLQGRESVVGLGECLHFFTCCNFRKELKNVCQGLSVHWVFLWMQRMENARRPVLPNFVQTLESAQRVRTHPPLPWSLSLITR